MFSVYGTSGLMYRGPIDNARKVLPALRATGARPVVFEFERDVLQAEGSGTYAGPSTSPRSAPAHAAQAYAQVQKPPVARQPLRTVADVMSPQAVVVSQHATLKEGWAVLAQHGIGQAPVVNAQGVLVGLLTRAELIQPEHLPEPEAHPLVWQAWLLRPVAEVMVTPISGVEADTDVRRLASLLLATGLPGVPVVSQQGQIQGFVSRSDILKALAHDPPLDLWAG